MRILIIGSTGMLGHKLAHVLGRNPQFKVFATCRGFPSTFLQAPNVDYINNINLSTEKYEADLSRALLHSKPDVVLNAAGAIKQKDLESAFHETLFLNGVVPHWLAIKLTGQGKKLIHVSTDCVFDGKLGNYSEKEPPQVIDLYGRSKAVGEVSYGAHLTLRTSIIGFETQGFLSLLSWFLQQPHDVPLKGFTRAIYSGLPTVNLAHLIEDILLNHLELSGLYHVASQPISKYELLTQFASAMKIKKTILPDSAYTLDRSLDDTLFRKATTTKRPNWSDLLAELVDDFQSLPYETLCENSRLQNQKLNF